MFFSLSLATVIASLLALAFLVRLSIRDLRRQKIEARRAALRSMRRDPPHRLRQP